MSQLGCRNLCLKYCLPAYSKSGTKFLGRGQNQDAKDIWKHNLKMHLIGKMKALQGIAKPVLGTHWFNPFSAFYGWGKRGSVTCPKLHSQPEGQASAPAMSDNDNDRFPTSAHPPCKDFSLRRPCRLTGQEDRKIEKKTPSFFFFF